jgi:hypothetical protein
MLEAKEQKRIKYLVYTLKQFIDNSTEPLYYMGLRVLGLGSTSGLKNGSGYQVTIEHKGEVPLEITYINNYHTKDGTNLVSWCLIDIVNQVSESLKTLANCANDFTKTTQNLNSLIQK